MISIIFNLHFMEELDRQIRSCKYLVRQSSAEEAQMVNLVKDIAVRASLSQDCLLQDHHQKVCCAAIL